MSAPSTSFVRRAVSIVLGFALLALVALPACGRSNLDDYLLSDGGAPPHDGGPDVIGDGPGPDNAACNATTCPNGCCDGAGVCQAGATITQCGALGEVCQNCSAKGFQLCDPTSHACGNPVASCDPASCSGCCEGNVCFAGSDPNECGLNGQACLHCESSNLACSPQQTCVQPACGPQTCSGCCFGDECLAGTDPAACGIKGAVCGNCLATGGKCVGEGTGGVCEGQTTCNASNCTGCCAGTQCLPGFAGSECGFGGQQCGNCQGMGGQCVPVGQGGVCEMQGGCTPQSCPGCCLGNSCLPGTDPNECGGGGQVCENCASVGGVCISQGGFGGFCENNNFCGPQSCQGCCEGNTCLPGADPTACGSFGEFCTDCTQFGESCGGFDAGFGQQCTPAACGPQNCSGCCAGNTCLQGNDSAACGTGGQLCTDCTSQSEMCLGGSDGGFGGGTCGMLPPPVCNAMTCPTGCCDGDAVPAGRPRPFCGTGGGTAPTAGRRRDLHRAERARRPADVQRRELPGVLRQRHVVSAGFIDTQCGESGASCEDCTQISRRRRATSASRRARAGPAGAVPCALSQLPGRPSRHLRPCSRTVCSASDLQNAQAACEGGAHSTACSLVLRLREVGEPRLRVVPDPLRLRLLRADGADDVRRAVHRRDLQPHHRRASSTAPTSLRPVRDSGPSDDVPERGAEHRVLELLQRRAVHRERVLRAGKLLRTRQGTGLFGDWLLQVGQFYCASQ